MKTVIGVITIIIGALMLVYGFSITTEFITQQTYKLILCSIGGIFIINGFICIANDKSDSKIREILYDIEYILRSIELQNKKDKDSSTPLKSNIITSKIDDNLRGNDKNYWEGIYNATKSDIFKT